MSVETLVLSGPKGPGLHSVGMHSGGMRDANADPGLAEASAKAEQAARLGLWIFLATVTMLFAAFTSAYLVRRGGTDWFDIPLPSVLWRNTAWLAGSSVALEAAWYGGTRRRRGVAGTAFAMALLLGALFVQGQVLAWNALTATGVLLPSGPHASFIYMLTGAHVAHVIAALGVLTWGAAVTWRGTASRDPVRWSHVMGTCRTFWHFLLGVWMYVFILLSAL